jgi:uncharacterized protein YjbI with pentapeptide repeats
MISFLYKHEDEKLELAIWDLTSHGDTQSHFPDKSERSGWYEGHYTPKKIECRTPNGRNKAAESLLKYDYPTFKNFLIYCLTQKTTGSLDLSGCDLKGVKLPASVGGSLYLSGCDLKGVKLPASVGGSLYLSGCDLTDVKIPKKFQNQISP